ncbi:MAG TPA: LysM domain-containing protein [Nocardioidaceae bacterium]|jgi:hypothetical protein
MKANTGIDALVVLLIAPIVTVVAAITLLCLAAAIAEAVLTRIAPLRPWRWSPAPHVLRRLAYAACGATLALPAATAAAVPAARSTTIDRTCPPVCVGRLEGLPLPDLPTSVPAADPIRVEPGDSLWLIATGLLDARADDSQVARAVARLYRTNRSVIGADPDLIFPGTSLTIPEVLR